MFNGFRIMALGFGPGPGPRGRIPLVISTIQYWFFKKSATSRDETSPCFTGHLFSEPPRKVGAEKPSFPRGFNCCQTKSKERFPKLDL